MVQKKEDHCVVQLVGDGLAIAEQVIVEIDRGGGGLSVVGLGEGSLDGR